MTLSITSPDGKRYSTLEELIEYAKEYYDGFSSLIDESEAKDELDVFIHYSAKKKSYMIILDEGDDCFLAWETIIENHTVEAFDRSQIEREKENEMIGKYIELLRLMNEEHKRRSDLEFEAMKKELLKRYPDQLLPKEQA